MSLFTSKESKFANNAGTISTKVQEIRELAFGRFSAMPKPAFGKSPLEKGNECINAIINKINTEYPEGADKKEIDAIDKDIFDRLAEIKADIQNNDVDRYALHVSLLMNKIINVRNFGRETQESAKLSEAIKVQQEVAAKLARVKRDLATNDAKIDSLSAQYTRLDDRDKKRHRQEFEEELDQLGDANKRLALTRDRLVAVHKRARRNVDILTAIAVGEENSTFDVPTVENILIGEQNVNAVIDHEAEMDTMLDENSVGVGGSSQFGSTSSFGKRALDAAEDEAARSALDDLDFGSYKSSSSSGESDPFGGI